MYICRPVSEMSIGLNQTSGSGYRKLNLNHYRNKGESKNCKHESKLLQIQIYSLKINTEFRGTT